MASQENSGCASYDPNDPIQKQVSRILMKLKLDPQGIINTGSDGVLRSLDEDRNVLDAVGLTTAQIAALNNRLPADYREEAGLNDAKWPSVDGTNVSHDQMFNPKKFDIELPEPLTEEQREEGRKLVESRPEFFREKYEERERKRQEAITEDAAAAEKA